MATGILAWHVDDKAGPEGRWGGDEHHFFYITFV
jgi:hypothetical protein